MSSVFLSHSHTDKAFARKFAAELRRAGHIVWIDEGEIEVGDSIIEKIREGIDRVDFIAAIISRASVDSEWVKRELDLASNREIDEKRVIVLPILLEEVELRGFLRGKAYADFRNGTDYEESLASVLRRLGPSSPAPPLEPSEMNQLRKQLTEMRKVVDFRERESQRRTRLVKLERSKKLDDAIRKENERHPEWAQINDTYAFQSCSVPVTLGYAFHAIHKDSMQGHPLGMGLTLENKWGNLRLMLEAYKDYRGLGDSESNQATST